MSDDRSRLLARLVPATGPTDPAAAVTWERLDAPTRAALTRAATDPIAAGSDRPGPHDAIVRDLARQRAARRPADLVAPIGTGLLVLSTLWGFGRAAYPQDADLWLVAGLVGLAATALAGARRVRARRRAAAEVLDRLGSDGPHERR